MSVYLKVKRAQAKIIGQNIKKEAQKLAIAIVITEFLLVTGYAIGEEYNMFDIFRRSNTIEIVQAKAIETKEQPKKIESTEDIIVRVAKENNFEDVSTLLAIAKCESNMDRYAKNKVSSARGIMQILDMHGLTEDERYNPAIATEWAIKEIRKNGTKAWNSSKNCWGE